MPTMDCYFFFQRIVIFFTCNVYDVCKIQHRRLLGLQKEIEKGSES